MNELITMEHVTRMFPNFEIGIRKAADLFSKINSFEDIETYLLRGRGLSPHTYASYLQAVKQLYDFTDGLNPFQITPGHIERFYDDLRKRVEINTACLRMRGLKKFFHCIAEQCPGFVSPFEIMSEPLLKKLKLTDKPATKSALTKAEMNRLLQWLSARMDPRGKLAYSAIFMLVTSGMRCAELCNLRWEDIEEIDGTYFANFIGKGNKPAHQELFEPALSSLNRKGEYLFTRIDDDRKLDNHALWYQISEVGKEARAAGIIGQGRRVTFSPHLFRRCFCTLLNKAGMTIPEVAENSRHSNISTLTKHYIDSREPTTPFLTKIFNVA